jgi:ribosomal protein L37AE/L43A
MDIYSSEYYELVNKTIDQQSKNFKPTALMIRQHNKTGLLYLHKTNRLSKIETYFGSGIKWKRHLKKHGENVTLLWYCIYLDIDSLVNAAVSISLNCNVIESDNWANSILEDGIGICCTGRIISEQTRTKMSIANKGRKFSDESNAKKGLRGERNGMFGVHRFGKEGPRYGKFASKESKEKSSLSQKARASIKHKCPHCDKSVDESNLRKWHLDNCKNSPNFDLNKYLEKKMIGRVSRISDHKEFDCGNWSIYMNSILK